jgi:hypothetical protein
MSNGIIAANDMVAVNDEIVGIAELVVAYLEVLS